MDKHDVMSFFEKFCKHIGEDSERQGVEETPQRLFAAWQELYRGYWQGPETVFKTFEGEGYDGVVLLRDIEFTSTCEHHLLPFFGKGHIAYIPDGPVIGVSKLARLLDIYSRRMQIQERICKQVTDALMKFLKPKGAACILEAKHLCISSRGVTKQSSVMVTSSLQGCFLTDHKCKEELLWLISKNGG